jgi:hypothetical protein
VSAASLFFSAYDSVKDGNNPQRNHLISSKIILHFNAQCLPVIFPSGRERGVARFIFYRVDGHSTRRRSKAVNSFFLLTLNSFSRGLSGTLTLYYLVKKIASPTDMDILITWLVPVFLLFLWCTDMPYGQCSGSVTFWYGSGSRSGSLDPYTWLMDPDLAPAPDLDLGPALFVTDSQDAKKQTNFFLQISWTLLLKVLQSLQR